MRAGYDTITQRGRTIRCGESFHVLGGMGGGLLDFRDNAGLETLDLGFRVLQMPEPESAVFPAFTGPLIACGR